MNENNVWFRFALEDLRMAELAMEDKIYNQVCFHSQQAVEKALKGYMEDKRILPPKTHKIVDLISLVNIKLGDLRDRIILLDRFYIPTRYPDALPGSLPEGLPQEKDAKEAIEIAKEFITKLEIQ